MTPKFWALLVGGLIPAFLLGIAGVFQKLANQHSIGTGPFLIVTGLTACLVGCFFLWTEQETQSDFASVGLTILFGICWAFASGLISLSLRKLGGTISQLVPLYNMNTLVAVVAALVLLSEWKTVNPTRIVLASALIIAGGLLAARS